MSTKKTSKSDSQTTKKKASSSKVSSQVNDFDVCDYDHQTTKILQRFITGTVHEVQYPLQTIAKRMDLLIEKYKDRDFEYIGYKEYKNIFKSLDLIKEQVKYCSDTIARLINISKKEIGSTSKKCDINEVMREIKTLFSQTVKLSNVQINLKLASNLPMAAIQASDLSQALVNILTNAIQSMPGGGTVTLKTMYAPSQNMITVECHDEGVGISKEALPHVFDPFFTTKERGLRRNSGLGLAIVSAVIGRYKGKIEIKSSLRKGTKVFLRIPVYKNGKKHV